MAGVFLSIGFVVDVDLLWNISGEGDIAQFDFVASARTGANTRRVIAECKGGDRWGYGDAFQLLGQAAMIGEELAVLLVAQRHSAEREARSARTIDQQFAQHGVHVIAVPVDDRSAGPPVADISAIEDTLFARGLVPMPGLDLNTADIEACTRGIARLRGAIERISRTLAHPMSPPHPPAAALLRVVRDWSVTAGDAAQRLALLRACLSAPNGSQAEWNPEAALAHRYFARDIAIVETYAAAQAAAALLEMIQADPARIYPWVSQVPADALRAQSLADLHAVSRAAYILALTSPSSQIAITARQTYGPAIAQLTISKRLRQRCHLPRVRSRVRRERAARRY